MTALGLGTAPLGGLYQPVSDGEAHATIARAVELGLRYIDTAPLYGRGLAERRVGAVLHEHPAGVVLSTKAGRLIVPDEHADDSIFRGASPSRVVFDFSRDGILRSVEASLERLQRARLDIVFIHDPDDYPDIAITEAYAALASLRTDGTITAIGVGMNQSEVPMRFVRETDIDCVLLAGRYSLLDQSGLQELLPLCLERGVAVVIGGVYNSGILANPVAGAPFDYRPAPAELVTRARRMGDVCAHHGVSLKAAAVQFPFGHPAVASVLTGARSVAELEDNIAMFEQPIPSAVWDRLRSEGLLRSDVPTPQGAR